MAKLFIYYSLTGNGDIVADRMEHHGFEIRKVETKKQLPKAFFFRMLAGGFQATRGKKAELVNYNADVSEYDTVVIGSPIWAGRITPAINTVLAETDLSDKNLVFVLWSGSGEGPAAQENIITAYPSAEIIFLKEPHKYPDELDKLIF